MQDIPIKGQPFPRLTAIAGPAPYEDTGFFFHHNDQATWVYTMKDPTAKEVAAIEVGPLEFRLVVEAPVLSMIGTSSVMSAERTFLPQPGLQRPVPADTTLNVVLVDARDGRVLVTRVIDVGQDFADRVAIAINTQARQEVSPAALARAEHLLQSRSVEQNKSRAVATCTVSPPGPHLFRPPATGAGLAGPGVQQLLGARQLAARQRRRGGRQQESDQAEETCPFVHVPHGMSSRTWSSARSSSLMPWSRVRSSCSASSCSACCTAQATSSWPTSLRIVQ